MSRPDRPYRATYVHTDRTIHCDYATKEDRRLARQGELGSVNGFNVTVTSRKPLRAGTPVCWVNIYHVDYRVGPGAHRTKEQAERNKAPGRTHCIPVYLPGEGAKPDHVLVDHVLVDATLVSRPARPYRATWECSTNTTLHRDFATKAARAAWYTGGDYHFTTVTSRKPLKGEACEVAKLKAEVERLTRELAEARANGESELASLRAVAAAAWLVYEPVSKLERALMGYTTKFGKPKEPTK